MPFFARTDEPPAEPLPPGRRGRVLYLSAYGGGVGGIERLTRTFATWFEGSGFTATMMFRHPALSRSAFTVESTPHVRVLAGSRWNRRLAKAPWDFVYVVPPGLGRRRWVPRIARLSGVRVVLDLDRKGHYRDVTDVVHCEVAPETPPDRPWVVATPDPRTTMPSVPSAPAERAYLTVFNPYGRVKGHDQIPRFLAGGERRLVWCWDPATYQRKRRAVRRLRAAVEEVRSPGLVTIEAPTRERLYDLYRTCAGYVCFSEREGLGWSLLDALALGRPVAARRVGICHALPGFQPTRDFADPVFGTYPLPAGLGLDRLFEDAAAAAGTDAARTRR